jgi:hypothetical protein
MLDRVVPTFHVVTQEPTSYRTGVRVIVGIKNSCRISLLLSKHHRNIVVKAEGGDVKQHFRFRY